MTRTKPPDAAPSHGEYRLSQLRMAALSRLVDGSMPVSLADLAADLAERRDGSLEPRCVKIRLHHVVLPKLNDTGLIDYDPDEHEITAAVGDVRPST